MQPQSDLPECLVYRNQVTGELVRLDEALDASRLNTLTYERDMEIIASYGLEDPGEGDEPWTL